MRRGRYSTAAIAKVPGRKCTEARLLRAGRSTAGVRRHYAPTAVIVRACYRVRPPWVERLLDRIAAADRALRAMPPRLTLPAPARASAADELSETPSGANAAALMRVNHAGEVAAQALYHGQALAARSAGDPGIAAQGCRGRGRSPRLVRERLRELGSRPSLLNPLWYAGSFAIGAVAARLGDGTSLGFVAETERQVEGHLDEHLRPPAERDASSRADRGGDARR